MGARHKILHRSQKSHKRCPRTHLWQSIPLAVTIGRVCPRNNIYKRDSLKFPLLLEGIFHPRHCDLQTLRSYKSSKLVLAWWSCCSFANSVWMNSIITRSIPLVPHQALHRCNCWLYWAWDPSPVTRLHLLLYYESPLCILFWRRIPPRVTANGVEFPFSDSHLANIWQFLLKVRQMRTPQNYICSGNSLKIPFAQDLDSTPNLPRIPPCVWCTTEWHHTNTKRKSRLLVWMTQSHAMSNFFPFSARHLQDNATTSMLNASLFS